MGEIGAEIVVIAHLGAGQKTAVTAYESLGKPHPRGADVPQVEELGLVAGGDGHLRVGEPVDRVNVPDPFKLV